MEKKCDHILGFEYGEEYGAYSGNVISLDDLSRDLSYESKLKSDDMFPCTYCPNCGAELKPIITDIVNKTKKEIKKRKDKEAREKAKRAKVFKEKVSLIMEKTKLSSLDSNNVYLVSFDNFDKFDPRDMILSGNPEYIARNIVSNLRGNELGDEFYFNKIIICPSLKSFQNDCKKADWTIKEKAIIKKEGNKEITLDYDDKSGIVYITNIYTDEDGDQNKNYDRVSILSLVPHYNIPTVFDEIKL